MSKFLISSVRIEARAKVFGSSEMITPYFVLKAYSNVLRYFNDGVDPSMEPST